MTTHETGGHERHGHGHFHLDETAWKAMALQTELQGELTLGYVTDTAAWIAELRGPDASAVKRVFDIGSGPGVGSCELARVFPDAHVVAVDSSPAMLERAAHRVDEHGLSGRVSTRLAELPGGFDGFGCADVIWASMSLHHIGDEVGALRVLGAVLASDGLIAIAEIAEPMRVLPDDLGDPDLGRPGLADRLDRAGAEWFAGMRNGLADSVSSTDLLAMLASAGFEVVGSRLARERVEAPLPESARRFVLGHLHRVREQFGELLDLDDLETLAVLSDPDDPRSVLHRSDVFIASSCQIVIARSIGGT